MKRDILLIAHFCSDFDGNGNNRFNYLAHLLANNNFDVELVTSDFSHNKKIKRSKLVEQYNYKVTFILEPAYSKNVSLKRFYSHYLMGRNLKKYLHNRKKPDVIYCAVPSLDLARVAAEYAKNNNIRFIIDIQDLWPEAFKMVFNVPLISNLLFYPMKRQADYVYAAADEIIAVSNTYAKRALKVNKKCTETNSIFLGTDLEYFDKLVLENQFSMKPKNELWVAYIGTLGHSYDISSVIDALRILKDQGINNIKFIVMGDGPLKKKFESYAKEQEINAEFTGRLDYGKMVGILKSCDIAVNPISRGAAQSIINKHADYAAAGLPVLNTQESVEYKNLVDEYQMGLNCENNNPKDLSVKLLKLYKDRTLSRNLGINSRKLAEDKFDREQTYKNIVEVVVINIFR
ncbi:glycosyltransferase family 4 protein [Psychrobacillus sp. NEAU-3TGS]|uniref:glycosyltransferase family 4 protein n=1 Tax=Psychrobacillus sp. NEAU-3TGS TaxID=2995412 RepID=UPI002497620B|nr:glycosyltransferase family 4 protein [Psychrobacillus sp. NEAU-3TGS]MDI2587666.1 glycosyltransferase family 4 protein [Psychrobacillus sp. NEAU-3TGS]